MAKKDTKKYYNLSREEDKFQKWRPSSYVLKPNVIDWRVEKKQKDLLGRGSLV